MLIRPIQELLPRIMSLTDTALHRNIHDILLGCQYNIQIMMAIHAGFMSDGHGSAGRSRFEAANSCRLQFRVLPFVV